MMRQSIVILGTCHDMFTYNYGQIDALADSFECKYIIMLFCFIVVVISKLNFHKIVHL